MAQAKKKSSTKTTKKAPVRKAGSRANTRTSKKAITSKERIHIYIITALSMMATVLLCADIAMMIV